MNKKVMKTELNRITEMKDLLEYGEPFPLPGFSDIRPDLKRAEALPLLQRGLGADVGDARVQAEVGAQRRVFEKGPGVGVPRQQ